jgi:hypothetical protein
VRLCIVGEKPVNKGFGVLQRSGANEALNGKPSGVAFAVAELSRKTDDGCFTALAVLI